MICILYAQHVRHFFVASVPSPAVIRIARSQRAQRVSYAPGAPAQLPASPEAAPHVTHTEAA